MDWKIFEHVPTAIVVVDNDGRCIYANPAWSDLSRRDSDECVGQAFSDCLQEADRQDCLRHGLPVDRASARWRMHAEEDCERWIEVHAQHVPEQAISILSIIDMTEPVQQHQSLQKAETLVEHVFNNQYALIAYLDKDFNFIKVNEAYARVDDRHPDDFPGRGHFELYPHEENQRIFERVRDTGQSHFAYAKPFEYEHSPDRGVTYWDWGLWPVTDDKNCVSAMVLILQNVTDRVHAEEERLRQQRMLEAVFDSANALLLVQDADGRIERFNKACEKITGYRADEVIGRPTWELFLPQDQAAEVQKIFYPLAQDSMPDECIREWRDKNGELHQVHWNNALVYDDDGNIVHAVAVGTDLTEEKRHLRALMRSEETLLNAQHIAHMGTWDWDIQHNHLGWSDGIYQIFGLGEQEFGCSYESFIACVHPDDRERVDQLVQTCLGDANAQYRTEHRIARPDGDIRYVEEIGRIYRDEAGQPTRMIGVVQDITERYLNDQQLRVHQQALDSAITPMAIADLDARLSYVNQAFVEAWGYESVDEVMAMPVHDFWEDAAGVDEVVSSIYESGRWSGQLTALCKNGERREMLLSASLTRDEQGEPICMMASFIDITENIQQQREIRAFNIGLEQQVLARTRELEQSLTAMRKEIQQRQRVQETLRIAKEEAERANQLKTEFLGRMSHELRTPLNAIIGFTQLLTLRLRDEKDKSFVQEIAQAGDHLLMLINDVLDLSRVESGKINLSLQTVPLARLVRQSIALVQTLAQEKDIHIEVDDIDAAFNVYADPARLKEVLVNLLSNAIKYNHEHGKVTISVDSGVDGAISIDVQDTGQGIEPEKLSRAFEPFNRLGAEYGEVEGTGIGLSISRALMSMMGGDLTVSSVVGEGSCFTIKCGPQPGADKPLASSHHAVDTADQGKQSTLARPAGHRFTILYIEDNDANQSLMQTVAGMRPAVDFRSAMTAEQGLKMAAECIPDLFILDIHLPGMDGYAALQQIRQDPRYRDSRVIALSAAAMQEDVQLGHQAGFEHYLTKPLQIYQLLEIIDSYM